MRSELALIKEIFKKENIPEKISFIKYIKNTINDIPRQMKILKQRFGIGR